MAIPCPHCGARTVRVGSLYTTKPYCPACGWNRDNAERLLRSDRGDLLAFPILGLFFAIWEWIRAGESVAFAIWLGLLFVFLGFIFFAQNWLALRRLAHVQSFSAEQIWQHSEAPAEASLPLPRNVRFVGKYYIHIFAYLLAASAVLVLVLVWASATKDRSDIWLWLIAALLAVEWLAAAPYGFIRSRLAERHLLRNGTVAAGVIRNAHSNPYRWLWLPLSWPVNVWYRSVVYEFRDAAGNLHRHEMRDWSKKLYEKMPVTVFYEAHDPNHSVAMECALARVVAT